MMLYYGSQYALDEIGGNLYLNAGIVGVAEIFTYSVMYFHIEHLKRKPFVFNVNLISVILCLGFFLHSLLP